MAYGDKRDYPKIDVYQKTYSKGGRVASVSYLCSTTWARTCSEAAWRASIALGKNPQDLIAYFDKGDK